MPKHCSDSPYLKGLTNSRLDNLIFKCAFYLRMSIREDIKLHAQSYLYMGSKLLRRIRMICRKIYWSKEFFSLLTNIKKQPWGRDTKCSYFLSLYGYLCPRTPLHIPYNRYNRCSVWLHWWIDKISFMQHSLLICNINMENIEFNVIF